MARKPFSTFSMAFLDVMACGLGAVILFLLIIAAQVSNKADSASESLKAQADRLEQQVLEGRKNLFRLRDEEAKRPAVTVDAAGEIERLQKLVASLRTELEQRDADSLARKDSVEQLRSDIRRLEEAKERLSAVTPKEASGTRMRSFTGEGNRQYLTGMRMGGQRVLILVDASASMMARTFVNVVRYRAMNDERKRQAPKWRQTVAAVDWLTTQIPPGTRFQIYVFNETARSVVEGSDGNWLEVRDAADLDRAVDALRKVVPGKGTSLVNAFAAAGKLQPAPDNIYLLTDGLPTQGKAPPASPTQVKPDQRATFFNQSLPLIPGRAPINVMLFPMDGDPAAAGFFWQLAMRSRGSFITPSRDWP